MKKTMLYTLAIAALPLVSAPVQAAFDGFYIGVSAGGTETSVKMDQNAAVNYFDATDSIDTSLFIQGPNSLKTDYAAKGALFVGYGRPLGERFYLGGEIFVDVGSYKNNQEIGEGGLVTANGGEEADWAWLLDTHTKVRSFQFGGDIRPGVFINWDSNKPATLLYGRVGVAFNRSSLDTDFGFLGNNVTYDVETLLPVSASTSKDRGSLRLGAGLEQEICPRLNARMDYIYTNYGHLSVQGANSVTTVTPGTSDTADGVTDTSVRITNNTVMLGLVYYPR